MDRLVSKIWPSSTFRDAVEYSVMLSVVSVVIVTVLRIFGVMH